MKHSSDDNRLDELLTDAKDLRVSADFDTWRREHPQAVASLKALPSAVVQQRRREMILRIARYSTTVAAAVMLAVGGVWWLVMSPGAAVAFADVIEQLEEAQSVAYEGTSLSGGHEDTHSVFSQGSRSRTESQSVTSITDFEERTTLFLVHASKKAILQRMQGAEYDDMFAEPPIHALQRLGDLESERLEDERVGDTLCHVFRIKDPSQYNEDLTTFKLWVDPVTKLPIQTHIVMKDGLASVTHSNFRWNQPFDESLFQMDVPEGYELSGPQPNTNAVEMLTPEESADLADTLEMIAEKTKANYDAIRSWSGTYELVRRLRGPDSWDRQNEDARLVWEESTASINFAIEKTPDRKRTDYIKTAPSLTILDASGETVRTSTLPQEYRWLRTPKCFIDFPVHSYREQVKGFPPVAGFGLSKDKRVPIVRGRIINMQGPGAESDYQSGVRYVDPDEFFGCGTRTAWTAWEMCSMYASWLRNESTEFNEAARATLRLSQRRSGGATEYVLTRRTGDNDVRAWVFSSALGLNLVQYSRTASSREDTQTWEYREVDGIFVPSEYDERETQFGRQEGPDRVFHYNYKLTDLQLNETIDPALFELEKMGLQYGDRLVDRMKRTLSVYDGREFVPADEFEMQSELLPERKIEPTPPETCHLQVRYDTAGRSRSGQVTLGMGARQVMELFFPAEDHSEDEHQILFDAALYDGRYLLLFTADADGGKLSQVMHFQGGEFSSIHLLPDAMRDQPVTGSHRALLEE